MFGAGSLAAAAGAQYAADVLPSEHDKPMFKYNGPVGAALLPSLVLLAGFGGSQMAAVLMVRIGWAGAWPVDWAGGWEPLCLPGTMPRQGSAQEQLCRGWGDSPSMAWLHSACGQHGPAPPFRGATLPSPPIALPARHRLEP